MDFLVGGNEYERMSIRGRAPRAHPLYDAWEMAYVLGTGTVVFEDLICHLWVAVVLGGGLLIWGIIQELYL
jgi:hypothetical protein